jgi:hypothetical protein
MVKVRGFKRTRKYLEVTIAVFPNSSYTYRLNMDVFPSKWKHS